MKPKRRGNVNQAAEILGIDSRTIENDRYKNPPKLGIPYHKVGGRVVYDLDEIETWFQARRRNPVT